MNYFEILDLKEEPFSSSPDPKFFYRSDRHEDCLHRLEISLRLLRGLIVVLGDVGTGKTTLCRKLIRTLNTDETVLAHLLLDPYFNSAGEFLTVLHRMICGDEPHAASSDWERKEGIKNALFRLGVDEKKIVVLIVDEGQKIHPECLEVLRELLNYETNDRKLLQIVIFAQSEFSEEVKKFPNVADRISDLNYLKPLSFSQTRALIRFRLDRAKVGYKAPELFTWGGYWAVHRATGGYPRKIIKLCHKSLLVCIMQNKRSISWAMVRSCARDSGLETTSSSWRWAFVALVLCLLGVGGYTAFQQDQRIRSWFAGGAANATGVNRVEDAAPLGRASLALETPANATAQGDNATAAGSGKTKPAEIADSPKPTTLGTLEVKPDEYALDMSKRIYGVNNEKAMRQLAEANPHIANIRRLNIGDQIHFPLLQEKTAKDFPRGHYALIDEYDTLLSAYNQFRAHRFLRQEARILSYWRKEGGLRFAVVANRAFANEALAQRFLQELPAGLKTNPKLVAEWSEDAVFYIKEGFREQTQAAAVTATAPPAASPPPPGKDKLFPPDAPKVQ